MPGTIGWQKYIMIYPNLLLVTYTMKTKDGDEVKLVKDGRGIKIKLNGDTILYIQKDWSMYWTWGYGYEGREVIIEDKEP